MVKNRKLPEGALEAHQKRSADTAIKIAKALEALLKKKTFEKITMVELAKEARLTPGAIYRRFKNKEALLPVIFQRYREELTLWVEQVTPEDLVKESDDLQAALKLLVYKTLVCFRKNSHIFRTVHLYARLNPNLKKSSPPQKGQKTPGTDFEPIGGLLEAFKGEISKDPEVAAQMIGHNLLSACIERALYPDHGPSNFVKVNDLKFSEIMSEMYFSWLKE